MRKQNQNQAQKPLAPTPKTIDQATAQVEADRDEIKARVMKFTGTVLSFIYRPHMGFADYAIVRLRLEEGIIMEVEEVSDPFACFEARAHMETKQAYLLEKMRRGYPAGFQHV